MCSRAIDSLSHHSFTCKMPATFGGWLCEQDAGDGRVGEGISKARGRMLSRGGRAGCEPGPCPVDSFPNSEQQIQESSLCPASVLSHTWPSLPLRYSTSQPSACPVTDQTRFLLPPTLLLDTHTLGSWGSLELPGARVGLIALGNYAEVC